MLMYHHRLIGVKTPAARLVERIRSSADRVSTLSLRKLIPITRPVAGQKFRVNHVGRFEFLERSGPAAGLSEILRLCRLDCTDLCDGTLFVVVHPRANYTATRQGQKQDEAACYAADRRSGRGDPISSKM
jgi:hypothetical protein